MCDDTETRRALTPEIRGGEDEEEITGLEEALGPRIAPPARPLRADALDENPEDDAE